MLWFVMSDQLKNLYNALKEQVLYRVILFILLFELVLKGALQNAFGNDVAMGIYIITLLMIITKFCRIAELLVGLLIYKVLIYNGLAEWIGRDEAVMYTLIFLVLMIGMDSQDKHKEAIVRIKPL